MFKKILLIILVLSLGFATSFAYAQTTDDTKFTELVNPMGEQDIWGVVSRAINILFMVCIYGGLILIIWAGWTMITAQGDAGKTKKAWQMIQSVLIGLVIVLLAKAIIGFTYYIVTGKKGGIPNLNNTKTQEENVPYTGQTNTIPELNKDWFNQ